MNVFEIVFLDIYENEVFRRVFIAEDEGEARKQGQELIRTATFLKGGCKIISCKKYLYSKERNSK